MRQIIEKNIKDLIPYCNNSRTHSDEQVQQIASSIKEFGFTNPVLIDEQGGIIAGHGRVMAAQKLKMDEVPTITLSGLSEAQKKAYIIADNKLALNAGWDDDLLKVEIEHLKELDFDLTLTGFNLDELANLFEPIVEDDINQESNYTKKIETPIYEIKGEKPNLTDIYCLKKFNDLKHEIEKKEIPSEIKEFLIHACSRFIKFDYQNIAEFYANTEDKEIKSIFEKLALVIIDYDSAIENGYITLSKELMELSKNDTTE